MHEQTKLILQQQRYGRLRNWCIALAITAAGVIASYLWLDQPIAFFVHRNVADKTMFIWLQRLPIVCLLLSLLVLAWCGLWALMDRPFSRVQSIGFACCLSFIATNFINNQLKYAFGRTWPDTWIDNNPSLIQNGVFGFIPFPWRPWLRLVPIGACSRSLCGDHSSLVVVCELAPDLSCLCSRDYNWASWGELPFFERHPERDLCWCFRRLHHDENINFEYGILKGSVLRFEFQHVRRRAMSDTFTSLHARVNLSSLHPIRTM
jgi:hypothetical protein